jgi:1,6-anhydro-N-acetylmuramate kinase
MLPRMSAPRTRLIAGCMTGTSLDGLDVALAEITGHGLDMCATLRGHLSMPLAGVAADLRRFAEGQPAPPIDFLRAARALGELHADAVAELCRRFLAHDQKLDLVAAHGQTIWHAPPQLHPDTVAAACDVAPAERRSVGTVLPTHRSDGTLLPTHRLDETVFQAGVSWQLFDPWPLVRRLQVPVCYDLRQADLIAGGQGAPITPLADFVLYRIGQTPRLVVNLGGICNITTLTGDHLQVTGRDVCPCNILLDAVVQRLFPPARFDKDGRIARGGKVVEMLHRAVFIDVMEILKGRCSLGREPFPLDVLDGWVATAMKYERPVDIVATYTFAVADLVAAGIEKNIASLAGGDVVLAGGGARNPVLVEFIRQRLRSPWPVLISDELGIPAEARESLAFAVLGALSQDGVPITLPAATGAHKPGRAGAWVYP